METKALENPSAIAALRQAAERLKEAGVDNPRLDAELLLAHALGCDRSRLFMEPDRAIGPLEAKAFQRMVDRRAGREPAHYILGKREFWSRDFAVGPEALIPRPETEFLIQRLIELYREHADAPRPSILDIGTGSGVLAVTAALEIPEGEITAWDVSARALELARKNAASHGVADRIRFLQGDMLDGEFSGRAGPYDFILSNPPYIPTAEVARLMPEVRDFEPHLALDGGPQGLDFIREIIRWAETALNPGGFLILEIGDGQWPAVKEMFSANYHRIDCQSDYGGAPRAVSAGKVIHGQI